MPLWARDSSFPGVGGTALRRLRIDEPSTTQPVQHAYLLTNYHVIRSAATAKVQLDDGQPGHIFDVVMEKRRRGLGGRDCLVCHRSTEPFQTNCNPRNRRRPEPPVGQKVYAIGSPKGLEASLSEGIISSRREVAEGIWGFRPPRPSATGSSGGPLLDSTGQVVGVTTAGLRGGQNLNFAIPASQILTFLKGRCNSRQLWRGTGIEEEEEYAYSDSRLPHLEMKMRMGDWMSDYRTPTRKSARGTTTMRCGTWRILFRPNLANTSTWFTTRLGEPPKGEVINGYFRTWQPKTFTTQ